MLTGAPGREVGECDCRFTNNVSVLPHGQGPRLWYPVHSKKGVVRWCMYSLPLFGVVLYGETRYSWPGMV